MTELPVQKERLQQWEDENRQLCRRSVTYAWAGDLTVQKTGQTLTGRVQPFAFVAPDSFTRRNRTLSLGPSSLHCWSTKCAVLTWALLRPSNLLARLLKLSSLSAALGWHWSSWPLWPVLLPMGGLLRTVLRSEALKSPVYAETRQKQNGDRQGHWHGIVCLLVQTGGGCPVSRIWGGS